ncbi:MAG: 50S ribosomal protein L23 [Candidatus Pacebacteria bacterium]|nr:50S ribosomal protein L23 [Candidatus Paceibacterota bacterium]
METVKEKKEKKVTLPRNLENVLIRPRVTEKASFRTGGNVYTFEVSKDSTKNDISKAIAHIYNVTPIKVNIAQIPAKRVFIRGRKGVKSGGKKAYVYLKEGDTIELI